jgi:subtilase family serine protease
MFESILRKPVLATNNFSPLLVCIKNYSLDASMIITYNLQAYMCILYIFNTVAKYVVRKLGQQ